jgi:hypothetical protein
MPPSTFGVDPVDVHHRDVRPFLGQAAGDAFADARPVAAYDSCFVFNFNSSSVVKG